jgi:chromosome segregation ATPase
VLPVQASAETMMAETLSTEIVTAQRGCDEDENEALERLRYHLTTLKQMYEHDMDLLQGELEREIVLCQPMKQQLAVLQQMLQQQQDELDQKEQRLVETQQQWRDITHFRLQQVNAVIVSQQQREQMHHMRVLQLSSRQNYEHRKLFERREAQLVEQQRQQLAAMRRWYEERYEERLRAAYSSGFCAAYGLAGLTVQSNADM